MNNPYGYADQSLTSRMARPLILELFRGQTVHRQDIMRRVDEIHVERGGATAETVVHPVVNALNWLKDRELANNPNPGDGMWEIYGEPEGNGDEIRRIGTGNKSVYVYYYPAYKERAELREEDTWPCKIGCTESANPIHRILEQPRTAMPEKPKVALVIRTDRQTELEDAIHQLLDSDHIPDAPGTEWFMTNPSKVEALYNILIPDY